MDIKHGQLSTLIYHDSDIIKRHEEFNIRVYNLLEKYSKDILDRYRQILTQQDIYKRTPLHYGAMNKFTKCAKTLEAIFAIDIDIVPEFEDFIHLFN